MGDAIASNLLLGWQCKLPFFRTEQSG